MKTIQINFEQPVMMRGFFGMAFPKLRSIDIDTTLPKCAERFVICHELYHLDDKAVNPIWREVKANAFAAIRHPLGFLWVLAHSLTKERLKLYYDRYIKGE